MGETEKESPCRQKSRRKGEQKENQANTKEKQKKHCEKGDNSHTKHQATTRLRLRLKVLRSLRGRSRAMWTGCVLSCSCSLGRCGPRRGCVRMCVRLFLRGSSPGRVPARVVMEMVGRKDGERRNTRSQAESENGTLRCARALAGHTAALRASLCSVFGIVLFLFLSALLFFVVSLRHVKRERTGERSNNTEGAPFSCVLAVKRL